MTPAAGAALATLVKPPSAAARSGSVQGGGSARLATFRPVSGTHGGRTCRPGGEGSASSCLRSKAAPAARQARQHQPLRPPPRLPAPRLAPVRPGWCSWRRHPIARAARPRSSRRTASAACQARRASSAAAAPVPVRACVANLRLRHRLISYARVSKTDGSQSLDLQRDALRAAGVDDAVNLYGDLASGGRDDRPGLDMLIGCSATPCGPTLSRPDGRQRDEATRSSLDVAG